MERMILAQADIMYSNMCYQFLLKSAAKSSLSSMGTDEVLDLPCVMILEIPIVPSKACNKGTRVVQTYLRMILDTSNLGASYQPQDSKISTSTWILRWCLLEHQMSCLFPVNKQVFDKSHAYMPRLMCYLNSHKTPLGLDGNTEVD